VLIWGVPRQAGYSIRVDEIAKFCHLVLNGTLPLWCVDPPPLRFALTPHSHDTHDTHDTHKHTRPRTHTRRIANAMAGEALYAEAHCWQSDEWRDLKARFAQPPFSVSRIASRAFCERVRCFVCVCDCACAVVLCCDDVMLLRYRDRLITDNTITKLLGPAKVRCLYSAEYRLTVGRD
jgi:hypothetical protein